MGSRSSGRPTITQRQRLGQRLRVMRELASLRNIDMAEALGVGAATISRMESGERLIKLGEIDIWVRTAGATAAAREELAALAEAAANQNTKWINRTTGGADTTQAETAELETTALTLLNYEHLMLPGLLQTRAYARRVFELADVGTENIDSKVTGRIHRQGILLDQSRSFQMLITEAGLRWRPVDIAQHIAQLEQVKVAMTLPNVHIGVLPLDGEASAIYPEGFCIYLDRTDGAEPVVVVELVSDEQTISETASVELYLREFERLRSGARYGQDARAIIDAVIGRLVQEGNPTEGGDAC
jgi:transcriptional regulator with XRE-family HTH domain